MKNKPKIVVAFNCGERVKVQLADVPVTFAGVVVGISGADVQVRPVGGECAVIVHYSTLTHN